MTSAFKDQYSNESEYTLDFSFEISLEIKILKG